jgi:hypothetical protein
VRILRVLKLNQGSLPTSARVGVDVGHVVGLASHKTHRDWQLLIEQESRWRLKEARTPIAALINVEDPKLAKGIDIHAMVRAEARRRYLTELTARQALRV